MLVRLDTGTGGLAGPLIWMGLRLMAGPGFECESDGCVLIEMEAKLAVAIATSVSTPVCGDVDAAGTVWPPAETLVRCESMSFT